MNSNQTPIDIHCLKLVDWLVQRRHCRKDWGTNLGLIRRKIRAALGDMPENEEIKNLLIGSKLDYYKSKKIVEILKTTEADSKNFFGYYSSQRMKDWQDIVYSYERDYIYIAEIATDLIRETSYEIPGIKKVINKLKSEKDDVEKKRANILRRGQQLNSEIQRLALSYGIEGVNVRHEFQQQLKNLSTVMNEVVELAQNLKPCLEYYREKAKTTSKQDANSFVSTLHYILNKGNTTVYEWKYGQAPEGIESTEKATSTSDDVELVDNEIDFGEDLPSSESSGGFVHVDNSDNGNESVDETFVKVDEESNSKIARGDEARLVLEYHKSRNQFLNNLHELEAFYVQILLNYSGTDDRGEQFSIDDTNKALGIIRKIQAIMNRERNRVLFQMNDCSSFIDNLEEKFSNKARQATNCNIQAEDMVEEIEKLNSQIKESEIHLKMSIQSAKKLQEKVETSISEMYSSRPINVMGCVN